MFQYFNYTLLRLHHKLICSTCTLGDMRYKAHLSHYVQPSLFHHSTIDHHESPSWWFAWCIHTCHNDHSRGNTCQTHQPSMNDIPCVIIWKNLTQNDDFWTMRLSCSACVQFFQACATRKFALMIFKNKTHDNGLTLVK